MVGGSVASLVAATAAFGLGAWREMLLGMIAPVMVASVTRVMVEHTFRRAPQRLTSLMIKMFIGKMVFFGAYVATVVAFLPLKAVPFVASFTVYFVALHATEAVYLRRLFQAGEPRVLANTCERLGTQ
jgi:hypothetical protein